MCVSSPIVCFTFQTVCYSIYIILTQNSEFDLLYLCVLHSYHRLHRLRGRQRSAPSTRQDPRFKRLQQSSQPRLTGQSKQPHFDWKSHFDQPKRLDDQRTLQQTATRRTDRDAYDHCIGDQLLVRSGGDTGSTQTTNSAAETSAQQPEHAFCIWHPNLEPWLCYSSKKATIHSQGWLP